MRPLLFFIFLLYTTFLFAADSVRLYSPDRKTEVVVRYDKEVTYSVKYNNRLLIPPSSINLVPEGKKNLWHDLTVKNKRFRTVNETIVSPVPEKRKIIPDHYNEVTLQFRQPYSLQFRAYDDGVAYRWITRFPDSLVIKNEIAQFTFLPQQPMLLPIIQERKDADRYHTPFEENYSLKTVDSLTDAVLAYTPLLIGGEGEVKVAVTESDLEDYPGMFLGGTGSSRLQGVFAPYPLQEKMTASEFPQALVTQRAPYIARTGGSRTFPWRVIMINDDKALPLNDLVYRLAPPSRVKDPSWIRPGQGIDEWIIGINLFNVPFKSGVNTATYKYYIDFAKRFGFERIMMDAGWSSYSNLFDINPEINMDTLSAYARSRGIRLSMWTLASTLDKQLDSALKQFTRWGVDFIMTDFMDRDDQPMVNFYHRVARACADHRIMLMYHGAFPPKGFTRTWPHAVTREGVLGSEYNIWSNRVTPEHDLILPFTRMLAGPLDYEPGLLDNATKDQFRSIERKVMSQGTRCHQLAMFVVYESPVQFFSGNPSQGWMEPRFMELLGDVPTTWDETRILEAKVSDYIITARRKGADWYIAGMTDWTAREFTLPLDFLDAGTYSAVLCADGINADKNAVDYTLSTFPQGKGQPLFIKMAPGGGFLLKLSKAGK